jgi:hypothetical protein
VFGEDDEQIRHALLSRFFTPYAEALADLVDERVAVTGQAIVIDLHCYLVEALPCRDTRTPGDRRFALASTSATLPQLSFSGCPVPSLLSVTLL